ncbi:hypothetical protein G6F62_007975 [Rhizopus arrhizus]|uniref:Uncharacterized protein n=1 Tax=Rhizopus oryzae TaxID=64495 RepID=A0A9P6X593_RHIOR|nr:hypothetical protein G6F23_004611 [Rhizopus arrhizus]KAG0760515.1 hypothetical protein G6F24_008253 [Rhizopus arrhizus]KAG0918701.1 hypothetical protein G6F33_000314 [Rhizopus arrhizus]KAG1152578.1 hypothetical protein G6F38_000400 [Rhizopus arrhizus]KAG1162952.1 hypothetical protein G6F37_001676 [Rhizopus arrhizus]
MPDNTSLLFSSKASRVEQKSYCYPPSPPLSNTGYHPSSLWSSKDQDMSSTYSVEKAIQVYGSQPALLGLILSSKVEEDRRKAEEAKLRQKEIDYALQRQKKDEEVKHPIPLPILSHFSPRGDSIHSFMEPSTRSTLPPLHMSLSENFEGPRKNSIDMLLIPPRPKLKLPEIAVAGTTAIQSKDEVHEENSNRHSALNSHESHTNPFPPSPPTETINPKKRKREIQAITTIIETKEFPYSDDYLWKNNGNTVHKKSGLKSIYYKCSNGTKVTDNDEESCS